MSSSRQKYILALDQGTSSSRAFLFDQEFRVVASSQKEFQQFYPQPAWVEHDAEEIWQSIHSCIQDCLHKSAISPKQINSIGISNQRETTVVWDRKTGKPIHRAIVWQSRQTESICRALKERDLDLAVKEKTGLVIDSYFSGPKIRWILDECDAQGVAEAGELCFGTIDSWLLWKLTGGVVHGTDYSNASRTMIYNIHKLEWDADLLRELNIPSAILPEVKDSSGFFGETDSKLFDGVKIPICGVAGDQQAALFGQQCFEKGTVKNTYGTGCFMLMNTGSEAVTSMNGLLTTIAWGLDDEICYALEGSVFIAGAAIQWLRDGLQLIEEASESEALADELSSNEGVYIVPAFNGLGTPYWKSEVRGSCFGLTRATDKRHFSRAVLEAIAYQSRDLLEAMQDDSGLKMDQLKVDGGACSNSFLMQFQSDLLGIDLLVPESLESSVLGAAYLAGLASGFTSTEQLNRLSGRSKNYQPKQDYEVMERYYQSWKRAIRASQVFSEE